jgi:hypothetical protein
MDEGTQGLIVLGLTALLVSVLMHTFIRRFFVACVGSTVIATLLFQVFAYWKLGYLDKFFVVAVITSGIFSLVISAIVGSAFVLYRRSKRRQ